MIPADSARHADGAQVAHGGNAALASPCEAGLIMRRFQIPEGMSLPNLDGLGAPDDDTRKSVISENVLQLNHAQIDASLTWEFVAWARQHWDGPIFVKVSCHIRSSC